MLTLPNVIFLMEGNVAQSERVAQIVRTPALWNELFKRTDSQKSIRGAHKIFWPEDQMFHYFFQEEEQILRLKNSNCSFSFCFCWITDSTCVPGDPLRIRWILDAFPLNTEAVYLWHPEFNISLQRKLWKCTAHDDTKPTSSSSDAGV